MKKDKHLVNKINEAINENSEMKFLDTVFTISAFEMGINGGYREKFYNDLIENFGNMYQDLREEGMFENEAKQQALYNITQKYLPGNNLKSPCIS